MWQEKLKQSNVSIHVIATGAGAGLQQQLWEMPGSSAYLSGCSFPYAMEEQEELLGFMPEHFVSEEAAVDLASAAYMKAYRFGGKDPVGVGITASVASEKEHRGDHRVYICVIDNKNIKLFHRNLKKGSGLEQRTADGSQCDYWGSCLLSEVIDDRIGLGAQDATELALTRFFERPFFTANGKRLASLPDSKHSAIMSGAFNPPHEGHASISQHVLDEYNLNVVYEVTAEPPHKAALTVQELLQRAKLLQGRDRLFTKKIPLYLDKARAFPGVPLVLGADAVVRMLDPKWGVNLIDLFAEFSRLNTTLLVSGRLIGDKFVSCEDILNDMRLNNFNLWVCAHNKLLPVNGRNDISSTDLRNKLA